MLSFYLSSVKYCTPLKSDVVIVARSLFTGWPQKVSHYQQALLNRIKNCHLRYVFHQFWVSTEHKNIISLY